MIIDLGPASRAGRGADDEAWQDVVLQPEPDAVDHVLQALINRARFKQVEVEEVATELVERADLQGQEVSEVLAELVGRADDTTLDAARTSELTLFNDEVPEPPRSAHRLRPAGTRPRRSASSSGCCACSWPAPRTSSCRPGPSGDERRATSWPLARAVWPLAATDDERRGPLPSRLAKSG